MRIALVGVGGYGSGYARALLGEHAREGVQVAGAIDPYWEASPVASEIREAGWPVYKTLDEFYARDAADLVVVSTPIQFHAPQAIRAMRAGSHVLLEKPAAATSGLIDDMIRARDEAGVKLAVGFQWCYDEAMRAFKRDADEGLFGRPRAFRALVIWPRLLGYYARGGGWAGREYAPDGAPIFDSVAMNATAHYLMNMLWLAGGGLAGARPLSCEAETARANKIETYDTCCMRFQLEGGCEAFFAATHAAEREIVQNPVFEYQFERATASFSADGDRMIRLNWQGGRETAYGPSNLDGGSGGSIKLWRMIDAVREGAEIPCTLETAARHASAIALAREVEPRAPFFKTATLDGDMMNVPGLGALIRRAYDERALPSELGVKFGADI